MENPTTHNVFEKRIKKSVQILDSIKGEKVLESSHQKYFVTNKK